VTSCDRVKRSKCSYKNIMIELPNMETVKLISYSMSSGSKHEQHVVLL